MAGTRCYEEFGYPLANLPVPGQAITEADLLDTVWPLIKGTRVLLSALGVALKTGDVTSEEGGEAIELLDGNLENAMHILQRFDASAARRRGDTGGRRREAHRSETTEADDDA
jgi:hypothetical protein